MAESENFDSFYTNIQHREFLDQKIYQQLEIKNSFQQMMKAYMLQLQHMHVPRAVK